MVHSGRGRKYTGELYVSAHRAGTCLHISGFVSSIASHAQIHNFIVQYTQCKYISSTRSNLPICLDIRHWINTHTITDNNRKITFYWPLIRNSRHVCRYFWGYFFAESAAVCLFYAYPLDRCISAARAAQPGWAGYHTTDTVMPAGHVRHSPDGQDIILQTQSY